MTNNTPDPTPRFARPIPKASDFVPIDRPADTSRNHRRGSRGTRTRRFVI